MTLVERLEAAEGPSRELDAEIAAALFPLVDAQDNLLVDGTAVFWRNTATDRLVSKPHEVEAPFSVVPNEKSEWGHTAGKVGWSVLDVPPYTSCLNAAMTLVPDGWCLRGLNETSDGQRADNTSEEALPRWSVAMIPHSLTGYANRKKTYGSWIYSGGATPALALCAAALRARSING